MGLTFVDLFCGIGTIRMGMEQAGHECVYSVEWDKHKRKIYSIIFGKEPEGSDIRATNARDIPRADVWCFGAPCQDFSPLQESEQVLKETEVLLFQKYLDSSGRLRKNIDPSIFSMKTLRECYPVIKDLTTSKYSIKWPHSGTTRNGRCQTVKTSESHRIGKGCSLSDILEDEVPEKYFLSNTKLTDILRSASQQKPQLLEHLQQEDIAEEITVE